MTLEEANKIIAEYMNYEFDEEVSFWYYEGDGPPVSLGFTESLDALVPVWEKLNFNPEFQIRPSKSLWFCNECYGYYEDRVSGNTIQEAACLATAKAIKELKDGNNG